MEREKFVKALKMDRFSNRIVLWNIERKEWNYNFFFIYKYLNEEWLDYENEAWSKF